MGHGGSRVMETSWEHGQDDNLDGFGSHSETQVNLYFLFWWELVWMHFKSRSQGTRAGSAGQCEEMQRQVRHEQDGFLLGFSCSQFAFFHSASRTVTNICHMLFPYSCSLGGQSCIPGSGICFDGLPDVHKLFDFICVNFSFSVTCCFFKKKSISVVALESPAHLMRLNHRIYSAATENIWKYVCLRAAVLRSLAAL